MKLQRAKMGLTLMSLLAGLLIIIAYPAVLIGGQIPPAWDVIKGKAELPTIEDLTDGKVKIGDLIDKNNVDLVKDYIGLGSYECIKKGMVMKMGNQLPPDQLHPKYFTEATERNVGKAVMDEYGTVYYEKMGTLWPGGLPFPEPKNGTEVAANVKFGQVWDDLYHNPVIVLLIDSEGKVYKTSVMEHRYTKCVSRLKVPPLGAVRGFEDMAWKRVIAMLHPFEIKGLGQYAVRFYDEVAHHDIGFTYLPAYKRTIRVSATTWQDNVAGGDTTSGDGQGLQEPYIYWDFKLIGPRYMLHPVPKSTIPFFDEKKKHIHKEFPHDVGRKFPRLEWTIWPMYELEARPTIKHIYGRKTFYVNAWPYWPSSSQFSHVDSYDRQLKLWKAYISFRGNHRIYEGEPYANEYGFSMYDIQADHMSHMWYPQRLNEAKFLPKNITMKTLQEISR